MVRLLRPCSECRTTLFARWHKFQALTKRADRLPTWFAAVQSDPLILFRGMEKHGIREVPSGFGPFTMHAAPMATAAIMGGMPWPLENVHVGVSVESAKYKTRIDHLRAVPAAVRFLSIEPLLEDVGALDLTGIHQVIVGAESGHGARPMRDDWVRSIRDQTKAQGVAFFFKQKAVNGRKVSLPMLDGRQWAEMP